MSPDERAVRDVLDRALRRGRTIAIAEAVAWGAAVAPFSIPAAIVVAGAVAFWRLRRASAVGVVRAIERTNAGVRNLFVTASELSDGRLAARPHVRVRVFADAALVSRAVDVTSIFSTRPLLQAIAVVAATWLLVASAPLWRRPVSRVLPRLVPPVETTASGPASATLRVAITIEPPAYTGRPQTTVVDPSHIETLEGSVARIVIDTRAGRVTMEQDGATHSLTPDATGRFADRVALTKTGYISIVAGSARRLIPVIVSPDALPAVRVTAPGRDLVFADAAQRVAFEARATDDFGLRSLSLQYTRVSGSGEQFDFQEGEIPLAIEHASGRDWRGNAAQALSALNLKDGDLIVYRAVAADARPAGGVASSDAFFIEISRLGVGAGDAFTLPEQETRYALSQQMLIIKTERLNAKRSEMAAADFHEQALDLAVEQRMVRAEFVFMLGGEVEDEEVEAAQSVELQEGRQQNRGQRDLRTATVAMSQAEKLLTGADTGDALTAERRAVDALQRAFSRDRYILRALASRTELDPKRRLTGDLSQAVNWRRDRPDPRSNRRAALLQDLLAGVAALPDTADAGPARAIELGREALSIDAGSAVLREAAADLQRIADSWSATAAGSRRQRLDTVAAAIARETARMLAGPPIVPGGVSPGLAGAFAEALRRGGAR